MQERIYQRIWKLSPLVHNEIAYDALKECTAELIDLYASQGRLSTDPFETVRHRKLSLPEGIVSSMLEHATCVVTGGLGCVGSKLVTELLRFNVSRIIILDIQYPKESTPVSEKIVHIHCDIKNLPMVEETFRIYQPDFVFHAAGQRDPGFAETHVLETVHTNVIGTFNIIQACELTPSIKQCVFASTGKASRYFTEEVYAITKKICEYLIDTYGKHSKLKYSMVRFTHILDNSMMNDQLAYASKYEKFIPLHCPAKYVTAQNAKEAAYLMLNALVFSESNTCKFLIVKNLEWPVESLEVALYHLHKSGRSIPIIFKGNPKGYAEKFFRGQMNWSRPEELNLLLNVYEHRFRTINAEDDIIISKIISADASLLEKFLNQLMTATPFDDVKQILITGLNEIIKEMLTRVSKLDTVNILKWGLQKEFFNEDVHAEDFNAITSLMFDSLKNSTEWQHIKNLWYDLRLEDHAEPYATHESLNFS